MGRIKTKHDLGQMVYLVSTRSHAFELDNSQPVQIIGVHIVGDVSYGCDEVDEEIVEYTILDHTQRQNTVPSCWLFKDLEDVVKVLEQEREQRIKSTNNIYDGLIQTLNDRKKVYEEG